MKDNLTEKIDSFWRWFEKMEPQYRKFFSDEPVNTELLIEAMNNRVLDFGQFKWEMREGKQGILQFIISPNCDHELFEVSKAIVQQQPRLDSWMFLPALPPQKTDFQFDMYDHAMRLIKIDATNWRFLLEDIEGLIEVVFEISDLKDVEFDTQIEAAETLLKKIIGEEKFIDKIGGLEVTEQFDDWEEGIAIQQIAQKFDEL